MNAKSISGLGIIAGLWLLVSPWAFGFFTSKSALAGNDLVGGIVIAIMMGIGFFSATGARYVSWIVALCGIWLIIAAFVYAQGASAAFWSNVLIGAITAAIGLFLMIRTSSST